MEASQTADSLFVRSALILPRLFSDHFCSALSALLCVLVTDRCRNLGPLTKRVRVITTHAMECDRFNITSGRGTWLPLRQTCVSQLHLHCSVRRISVLYNSYEFGLSSHYKYVSSLNSELYQSCLELLSHSYSCANTPNLILTRRIMLSHEPFQHSHSTAK